MPYPVTCTALNVEITYPTCSEQLETIRMSPVIVSIYPSSLILEHLFYLRHHTWHSQTRNERVRIVLDQPKRTTLRLTLSMPTSKEAIGE